MFRKIIEVVVFSSFLGIIFSGILDLGVYFFTHPGGGINPDNAPVWYLLATAIGIAVGLSVFIPEIQRLRRDPEHWSAWDDNRNS